MQVGRQGCRAKEERRGGISGILKTWPEAPFIPQALNLFSEGEWSQKLYRQNYIVNFPLVNFLKKLRYLLNST